MAEAMAEAALRPARAPRLAWPAPASTAPALHHLVLCADDYGLTAGVSRGILELLAQGRLSAVGAMTNMAPWPGLAGPLRAARGHAAVGLHLNLTTGAPLGAMPQLAPSGALPRLGSLLHRLLVGRTRLAAELSAEIHRQLDAFEAAFGTPPEFVDGHQHVHVLPVVRGVLLRTLAARFAGAATRPWLRDPADRAAAILQRRLCANKGAVVAALATGFRRAAQRAGFDTNEGFSGFSPLQAGTSAPQVMQRALLRLGPRPLVMCHPGHADAALRALDPAVESRAAELAFLGSASFCCLLEQHRIILVPRP
jgi:predicted glycoside hydrolase/deacetylase ChbG (UPF0249 family)